MMFDKAIIMIQNQEPGVLWANLINTLPMNGACAR